MFLFTKIVMQANKKALLQVNYMSVIKINEKK